MTQSDEQQAQRAEIVQGPKNPMALFVWHVVLALIWTFASGRFTLPNVIVGFLLAYAMLWLGYRIFHTGRYRSKFGQAVTFLLFFLWELLTANLRVAVDVLTPRPRMRPGIVAVPLDARTDLEITLLANFIGLTPGTFAVDVSADRRFMYVHVMFLDDPERAKRGIKSGFERRLLELLR